MWDYTHQHVSDEVADAVGSDRPRRVGLHQHVNNEVVDTVGGGSPGCVGLHVSNQVADNYIHQQHVKDNNM